MGGDVIRMDAPIMDGKRLAPYQSARVWNISFEFQNLQLGDYLVNLHFVDAIFIVSPSRMRNFDGFIQ